MQGQGKRLLLAVGIALGVMLVWNMVFPPKEDPKPPTTATGSGSGSGSGSGVAAVPSMDQAPVGKTTVVGIDTSEKPTSTDVPKCDVSSTIELAFENKFTAKFCSHGAALVSWKLADPRFNKKIVWPKGEPKGEPDRTEDLPEGELISQSPGTGAFQVGFREGSSRFLPAQTEWVGKKIADDKVVYTYSHNGIELEKTFTIKPEQFLVVMQLKSKVAVAEGQKAEQTLVISTFAHPNPKESSAGSSQVAARMWSSSTLREGSIVQTPLDELKKAARPRYEGGPGKSITWTGFEHPYLLAAYAPHLRSANEFVWKATFLAGADGLMRTDIVFPPVLTKANDPAGPATEVVAYLGPKNYKNLNEADAAVSEVLGDKEFATGFKQTIDMGWFAFIGRPLQWLLLQLQSVVGNWGIAIILLTFLVKGATLYWTTKSMRSMKAMAALAPQLKGLQEKYKDDKQRIQAETMALYKQNNVNPIAGCLPILLQMPIWIALYRMLSNAGELYQQPFIPGWIDDLTMTDPYHVLPVILVVTMFVQARLTPATGDSRQQKFLQYGMPLMFGVMSFFFPAGLTLYIFTNTCLSALHSIYMNKFDKKSLAIAAQLKKNKEAAEAAAAAAAKPAANGAGAKKNGKPAPKKPVIDVESVEQTDDDDDDAEEGAAASPAGSGSSPARQRPKRKKRRR